METPTTPEPILAQLDDIPPSVQGKIITIWAECDSLEKQLKVAHARQFEFFSDEPERLGGDDKYPQPLQYLVAGLGFCLLTQLELYAAMRKKVITKAHMRCEMDIYREGSVLAGTVRGVVREIRTELSIESPEPDDVVADLIAMAKRGCFAEQLVTNATPITATTVLNGKPFAAA